MTDSPSTADGLLSSGLREELITERLESALATLVDGRVERRGVEPAESLELLRRYASSLLREALARHGSAPGAHSAAVNELVGLLMMDDAERFRLLEPPEVLLGIVPEADGLTNLGLPPRPQVPLTANELLVNDRKQPSIGSQLKSELASADAVDLICAFVQFSGVNTMLEELRALTARGGRLRVITTTYMGATQPKALNALVDAGAHVRVAFDAQRTKLHAKAWVLGRPRGLSTAFVGSSNLSITAMHHGLEWNVRLAEAEAASVIDRMRATFETYWAEDAFEAYDPAQDGDRLEAALGRQRNGGGGPPLSIAFAGLDVHPHPHQRRMLEDLMVQRDRHDRHRNLVVAATGTGKTVVAAFDYKALCDRAGRRLSLLFVAHREQILRQSQATFQAITKDPAFGEIHGGGHRPHAGTQVFAMVQSLQAAAVASIDPTAYDVVIVDEFHHAEAPSYTALLEHLEPAEFLGLTATPERMDGQDVTTWFGGRIAVELRVWEAIDRGYLVPFQYFGVRDTADLGDLAWRRGGYLPADLDRVFTGNDARSKRVVDALERYHADPGAMRALGFCVSVAHAEFMARKFQEAGLPARSITGQTPEDERRAILDALRRGELRCVFSVDVLGEGVDVPNVDTILLLRPTQSATVFSQQLGRGLRLSENKAHLTVIDLIGQQHRQFRFEDRLRAIVDERTGTIREQAEEGFPYLPSGCSLTLDRESEKIVLDNLKRAATLTQWRTLVEELGELGDVPLETYLRATDRRPEDLYRAADRSWTRLRRDAGLAVPALGPRGDESLRPVHRLGHIDDPERTSFYRSILSDDVRPASVDLTPRQQRMLAMLLDGLRIAEKGDDLDQACARLWPHAALRSELVELFDVLDDADTRLHPALDLPRDIPIDLHASYTRAEALLGFGDGTVGKPSTVREGVRFVTGANADLLFVTLRKSEKSFSPTTMYRDYALSRTLFHWESQNAAHHGTPTGQRYIHHRTRGSSVVLFVRELESRPNGSGAPFTCLGPVDYQGHEGGRPMQITWRLHHPLPEALLEASQLVAAA